MSGWLNTTKTVSVMSNVPKDMTTAKLVSTLQDHILMMKCQPLIDTVEEEDVPATIKASSPEYEREKWYRLEEVVPVVGRIKFYASWKNVENGCDSVANVPQGTGLLMRVSWRVIDKQGHRFLDEECEFEGNRLTMPFATWNMEKAHRTLHDEVLRIAAGGQLPEKWQGVEGRARSTDGKVDTTEQKPKPDQPSSFKVKDFRCERCGQHGAHAPNAACPRA